MGWKIIEIDSPAIIKTFLNNLLIFKENKIIIPINDIDVLMISDTRTTLTVNTINEIVKNGTCVILCDNKKIPVSYILGYKVQKQSYITFKKQLEWDNEFKSNCWNWILRQKINNQLNFLNYLQINTNEFIDYNTNPLTEAKIASFFFKSLYGRSFNRNKDLLINNLLDYGYVILTNMVARSITKKGLNLQISFYHGSIYSNMPLAYDIVELFRIVVDIFVKYLFDNDILNENKFFNTKIKHCLLDFIANYKIKINDKYEFVNNAIDICVDWIISNSFNENKMEYDYEIEFASKTKIS